MKEHPILFSAPLVRAILAGRKSQTRRPVKPQPPSSDSVRAMSGIDFSIFTDQHTPGTFRVAGPVWAVRELMHGEQQWRCPYGAPGDRLWVRETWCLPDPYDRRTICYRATHDPVTTGAPWRPSIHMPRWASRISLLVTGVRVQRLGEISEEDAVAEGMEPITGDTARETFAAAWLDMHGGYDPATWVWAISFQRQEVTP